MKKIATIIASLICVLPLSADEGMWMLNSVDRRTQSFAKAVVSIDFMGTGSLISDEGLVITNHHVAYSDVFSLSSAEHNYLEDGFWAHSRAEELPIPGRHIQMLVETIDVTDEVEELYANGTVKRGPMSMRRMSGILEKKYEQQTGLVASLGTYWSGSKYYISLYREYRDIRLVAAPPVCIGAFGGDIDNWEWPQQKCDFAMLRIYTAPDGSPADYSAENVPLRSPARLKVSTKGYRKGDRTIVIGYPGKTDRYASSAKVRYLTDVTLPVSTSIRGGQMDIIKKWMNDDPAVRLKYSEQFFSMSNAQELYAGELQCYKAFDVADERKAAERELKAWIESDRDRMARWGTLLDDLDAKYELVRNADRNLNYFRESIVRGTKLNVVSSRLASTGRSFTKDRAESTRSSSRKTYESIDLRVERDIFRYSLEVFFENVEKDCWGTFQKELAGKFGKDYDAMCAYLWDSSWMTREEGYSEFLNPEVEMTQDKVREWQQDRLCRFFEDNQYATFSMTSRNLVGEPSLSALDKEYTCALYQMNLSKGRRQYPNANSTLRVSFGKVGGYSPQDAVWCDYKSSVAGILAKHNPDDHDFCLNPEWKKVLSTADRKMPVDFLSDNDITGGNSGSPVMNSKGQLIGLAFDGNKESLASDISFTKDYNRCINVDIRFVLWTLRNYAHMDSILAEIEK